MGGTARSVVSSCRGTKQHYCTANYVHLAACSCLCFNVEADLFQSVELSPSTLLSRDLCLMFADDCFCFCFCFCRRNQKETCVLERDMYSFACARRALSLSCFSKHALRIPCADNGSNSSNRSYINSSRDSISSHRCHAEKNTPCCLSTRLFCARGARFFLFHTMLCDLMGWDGTGWNVIQQAAAASLRLDAATMQGGEPATAAGIMQARIGHRYLVYF